ncbi:MAG: Cas10/Cmr2 second palm domain-containing protein [Gammaproteobacteria bacterium]
MTAEYLFRAEADQIQDTLFRAARLRQVIGGSRLIAEFGRVAAQIASECGATHVPIKAGGNLLAVFPTPKAAAEFEDLLANAYRELMDAPLTVAGEPISLPDGFRQANENLHRALKHRKVAERGQQASAQTPTTAFCQSSGAGLAGDLVKSERQRADGKTRYDYISAAVKRMEEAGKQARDIGEESFLGRIAACLPRALRERAWPHRVEEIEALDPRRNVAYLLADGNGMGKLFGACGSLDQLKALSDALDESLRQALVLPLREQLELDCYRQLDFLPLLPLILAGDDLFVLLPARYALDYARQFCLAFETQMRERLNTKVLESLLPLAPTVSAAVVICKGHYPYRLAHQRGEARLAAAKQLAKEFAQQSPDGDRLSAVNFELIAGNELTDPVVDKAQRYRAEMRPYWAAGGVSARATRLALPLATLLEQRFILAESAGKRLAEFRELYAPERLPIKDDGLPQWQHELARVLERIAASDPLELLHTKPRPVTQQELWRSALLVLGDGKQSGDKRGARKEENYWREMERVSGLFNASALPDLLDVWDYAQALDKSLADYEGEGR